MTPSIVNYLHPLNYLYAMVNKRVRLVLVTGKIVLVKVYAVLPTSKNCKTKLCTVMTIASENVERQLGFDLKIAILHPEMPPRRKFIQMSLTTRASAQAATSYALGYSRLISGHGGTVQMACALAVPRIYLLCPQDHTNVDSVCCLRHAPARDTCLNFEPTLHPRVQNIKNGR
jgi:hypothetical protein